MKKGNFIYNLFLFHYVLLLMATIPLSALQGGCLCETQGYPSSPSSPPLSLPSFLPPFSFSFLRAFCEALTQVK